MRNREDTGTHGLQNNAYDFAYSKKEDFLSRGWGHASLFLWGGTTGAFQKLSWDKEFGFGMSLFYDGIIWGGNGFIKGNYYGFKFDGNKALVQYFKYLLNINSLN
jgi:hypothetical protein